MWIRRYSPILAFLLTVFQASMMILLSSLDFVTSAVPKPPALAIHVLGSNCGVVSWVQ
ncbi:hypothetical protein EV363DRAFT_1403249 [Boletus edulis]|nr:hypothetical protein EV363DRAFT_1403249 [Boletus edulis]